MSIHKYPEALMFAVYLNPERLVWNKGEVGNGCFLLRPIPRDASIAQELAITEPSSEFQCHVVLRLLLFIFQATCQANIKATDEKE